MLPELKRLIEQMGKDRGIDKSIITEALEAAMLTAARKKLGQNVDIEAHYNDEVGEIEVFQFKTVVDKVLDPETQISKEEARKTLDEGAEPGDSLGMKIETSSFGRIAVQMAKQIIIQRVKDAERDNIYDEYKDRKGELVNGFVQRFEGGAQGEHKMARALLPVRTHSAHWLAHPAFADAVDRFLAQERLGVDRYLQELWRHSPLKN